MPHARRPRKVALISSYPLHVGGVETHLFSLMRHIGPDQVDWTVIGPCSAEFSAQAASRGARIVQWKPAHVADLASLRTLAGHLRRHDIALAHFHCPRAAFMARPLTRWLGIPAVVTVHLPPYYFSNSSYTSGGFGRWLYMRMESALNRWFTTRLIYASSHVMREAAAMGLTDAVRTVFIGNGIDLARYETQRHRAALRQRHGIGDDEQLIISVCRLDAQKGVDILLAAIAELDLAAAGAWLWIAGDGPLRAALEQQARQTRSAARIVFQGFRDDVPQLLGASDLFVLASRFEAMPYAILEAMAAGLPCVVTDTGENALMIEHGVSGYVVPVNDAPALTAALKVALSDPAQTWRMKKNARLRAEQYSDIETARRISDIYLTAAP
ncbi:MAG: glycosyltransferase family 4 protein [Blastocatellia bacterium]